MSVSVPWHRSAAQSRPAGRAGLVARKDWRASLFSRAVLGVVIALALVWLIPVAWALDTSVKPENATIAIPASWAVPKFTLGAYGAVGTRPRPGDWITRSRRVR